MSNLRSSHYEFVNYSDKINVSSDKCNLEHSCEAISGDKICVCLFKKVVAVKTKSAAPTTVGEMLSLEFLKPLGMSAYKLSNKMNISYKRMIDTVKIEYSITRKGYTSLSTIFNTDIFW